MGSSRHTGLRCVRREGGIVVAQCGRMGNAERLSLRGAADVAAGADRDVRPQRDPRLTDLLVDATTTLRHRNLMTRAVHIWKRHSQSVAWASALLALVVVLGYAATVAAALAGVVPTWAASTALTALLYVAFTPMHEAAHQNVSGGVRRWRWLDPAVGWAMSLLFLSPFPAFRAVHLHHHGRTNQEDDPDRWVAGQRWWSVALRCLSILPHYDVVYLRRLMWLTPATRRDGRGVIAAFVAIGLGLALAVGLGHGRAVLTLWIGPVWLASGLLALAFDWLPHVPHQRIGRYVDTRAIDVRWLDTPLLGQNLHAVHHLYPRVPFYRYRAVFDAMGEEFEGKGTEVVRWQR